MLEIAALLDAKQPFALIEKAGRMSLYRGELYRIDTLKDIHDLSRAENTDVVFVLPYRAIRERGFEAQGNEPILALSVQEHVSLTTQAALRQLPQEPLALEGEIKPSVDDAAYAQLIEKFQAQEIEGGYVSQTTISRKFFGQIQDFSFQKLLSAYRRIIAEKGHYMAVLFCDPAADKFILAATPERHLEVAGTQTIMTPIAGTLRKEDRESFKARLDDFLRDEKEINELFQVLDEEMKMMGLICPQGGKIEGPYLREVGAVVHSEYNLVGKRTLHSIDALRETLHAPTVVGSPMESAARVIAKYEPESRGYYAGEIGVYRRPRSTAPDGDIDSAILIRMAEISTKGAFHVQAGGGLVRDSVPENEAKESRAKAMGILKYFTQDQDVQPYLEPEHLETVRPLLQARNEKLSQFWMQKQNPYQEDTKADLGDLKVTIVNNEDNFAYMIAHVIKSFKCDVSVIDSFDFDAKRDTSDILILGPGPGDPNDLNNPRIVKLHDIAKHSKGTKPILGVCLGHQVLALLEGLDVIQQTSSTQGMPRHVRVDDDMHQLGFYNSFSPTLAHEHPTPEGLEIDLDEQGRVIAMRGDQMIGFQFHPESVMSKTGSNLLLAAIKTLIA